MTADDPASIGRVLIVAGSDSGGGAGIQADIKTVTALGGYAATAITAITVQDTLGVHGIYGIPPETVAEQMRVVLKDIGADAIKTGMLHSAEIIDAVVAVLAECLDDMEDAPAIIIDPVMVATSGDRLLAADAESALRERLLPLATLITPNVHEAAVLTGNTIESAEDMRAAADALLELGPEAVLVTGGDLSGDVVLDVLATPAQSQIFTSPRIASHGGHGTGCTLASAIAARMAQGADVFAAVADARDYVQGAIRHAPGFGAGNGPLDHGWMLRDD